MPQYIRPPANIYPCIDGTYHGRTVSVRDGLNYLKVAKTRPKPILAEFDEVPSPDDCWFETETYHRVTIIMHLAPTKDAKRQRLRIYEAFMLAGMNGDDAAKELKYMLLRRPANRPLYGTQEPQP